MGACFELRLRELSVFLYNNAAAGYDSPMKRMWAQEEVTWEIEHLIFAVDNNEWYME